MSAPEIPDLLNNSIIISIQTLFTGEEPTRSVEQHSPEIILLYRLAE